MSLSRRVVASTLKDCKGRDHGEENGQEFTAPAPVAVAEDQRRRKIDREIDASDGGQPGRIVRRRIDQLEPGEAGKLNESRPTAEFVREPHQDRQPEAS